MITIENVTAFEPDFESAISILERFKELDEYDMLPVICMMLDTAAAKRHEAPMKTVQLVAEAVKTVNDECGTYDPYLGEEAHYHEENV